MPKPSAALVIPSSRKADQLGRFVRLALQLNCPLIFLCSKRSKIADVVSQLRWWDPRGELRWAVADIPAGYSHPLLSMPTDDHPLLLRADRQNDTAHKRNIALLFQIEDTVCCDDDLSGVTPAKVAKLLQASTAHGVAGLSCYEFPDRSVVRHAADRVGAAALVSPGMGLYVTRASRMFAYCPNIFNHDWFMFRAQGYGASSHPELEDFRIYQSEFEVYSPGRAQFQEFGDLLAEALDGIYGVSPPFGCGSHASGRGTHRITVSSKEQEQDKFWARAIDERRLTIEKIIKWNSTLGHQDDVLVTRALEASLKRLSTIEPTHRVKYLELWHDGLRQWRHHLALMRKASITEVFETLGLEYINNL